MDVRNVNVCSEQPEQLIKFYADVVGLPNIPQFGPGAFRAGGAAFLVDGHSGVRAPARRSRSAYSSPSP